MGLHRGGCVGLGLEGGAGIWDKEPHKQKPRSWGAHWLIGRCWLVIPRERRAGSGGGRREAGLGGALVVIAAHVAGTFLPSLVHLALIQLPLHICISHG